MLRVSVRPEALLRLAIGTLLVGLAAAGFAQAWAGVDLLQPAAAPLLLLGMGGWVARFQPRGSAPHPVLLCAALVLVLVLWVARLVGELPTAV